MKTQVTHIRLEPKLKEQLERYAKSNNKFLSEQARDILKNHLANQGDNENK